MGRELLLLGLLRQQDRHGYELYDFIERTMQSCVDLKKSTAYYLLDKMAKRGLIIEMIEDPPASGNRPPRRVYQITPAGEEHFQELLRQNLANYEPATYSSVVGLYFLDQLDPVEARPLLEQRQVELRAQLERVTAVPQHPGSLQYVIEHKRMHLQAELTWLETIINNFQNS